MYWQLAAERQAQCRAPAKPTRVEVHFYQGRKMPHIVMKPVHWNPRGYRQPAGHRATSGYPKLWGFGHEEWNNAPDMTFLKDGVRYRAFHTEPAASPSPGVINDHVVFMYASHDRVQELVGVAAKAIDLTEYPMWRAEIRAQIPFDRHLGEVLALLRAGLLPVHDAKALERNWHAEQQYLPRWVCPEEHFLWLERPVPLNPQIIRGTSKFLTMYSSYTALDIGQAMRTMNAIPIALRLPAWQRVHDEIWNVQDDSAADLETIEKDRSLDKTTREQLIQARCGQGHFRQAVLQRWQQRCAVTGCTVTEALSASHIQSWRDSDNRQRLDCDNGLALVASIDAMFDRALITFDNDGTMLVSPSISAEDRTILGLPAPLRLPLNVRQRAYMTAHRAQFTRRSS